MSKADGKEKYFWIRCNTIIRALHVDPTLFPDWDSFRSLVAVELSCQVASLHFAMEGSMIKPPLSYMKSFADIDVSIAIDNSYLKPIRPSALICRVNDHKTRQEVQVMARVIAEIHFRYDQKVKVPEIRKNAWLVCWPEPIKINWGRGPTKAMSYAILREDGRAMALYLDESKIIAMHDEMALKSPCFEEVMQLWPDDVFQYGASWKSTVAAEQCFVCMDAKPTFVVSCGMCCSEVCHACESCATKFEAWKSVCPQCRNNAVIYICSNPVWQK